LTFGAIGYRKLAGVPLTPAAAGEPVAADLADFLASLHRYPVAEAERLGVPHAIGWSEAVAELEADVLPALRDLVTPDERASLERWLAEVSADAALEDFAPALCHRDLWYENVLVAGAPARLVGVVDWEAARIGDPAQDLAVQWHLGESFAAAVLTAYGPPDARFSARVERFWELREFAGLRWSLEQDDEVELADSIAKLRAGPILGPQTRGIA
jgi:aminoglycoside phosphotransferase (APT) family kinase protein